MKAVQKFSPEYLKLCAKMKPEQVVMFLENFRLIHGGMANKSSVGRGQKFIRIKIEKPLHHVFKVRCQLLGIPYQTQIKNLMVEWLRDKKGSDLK